MTIRKVYFIICCLALLQTPLYSQCIFDTIQCHKNKPLFKLEVWSDSIAGLRVTVTNLVRQPFFLIRSGNDLRVAAIMGDTYYLTPYRDPLSDIEFYELKKVTKNDSPYWEIPVDISKKITISLSLVFKDQVVKKGKRLFVRNPSYYTNKLSHSYEIDSQ